MTLLCKNCVFYRASLAINSDKCTHPRCTRVEFIRGTSSYLICIDARANDNYCGYEAKLYLPSKST